MPRCATFGWREPGSAIALDEAIARISGTILEHAPLTLWASKVAVARLRRAVLPNDDDLVRETYGSEDFRRAVAAFSSKGKRDRQAWTGA